VVLGGLKRGVRLGEAIRPLPNLVLHHDGGRTVRAPAPAADPGAPAPPCPAPPRAALLRRCGHSGRAHRCGCGDHHSARRSAYAYAELLDRHGRERCGNGARPRAGEQPRTQPATRGVEAGARGRDRRTGDAPRHDPGPEPPPTRGSTMKLASILPLAISLLLTAGCATMDTVRAQNRANLNRLALGMTKEEVLAV